MATTRGRIIEALLQLLAEHQYERIGLADIAARAGVSLETVREEFGTRLAILSAHMKEIDREVLALGSADMAEEPQRERLFDVEMRRFEALAPYKEALRSLMNSACVNPGLACALNALAVRSQLWMLAAAGIPSGPFELVRAQGLACLFASVVPTFVNEDEPGHPRTMAALDRALGRGQRWVDFANDLCRLVPGRRFMGRSRWREPREEGGGGEPVTV
jgi:AcrR family transcriptional regulator